MSVVLNALLSIANYLGYSTSDKPTSNADMQTFMKNQNDVLTAVVAGGGLWQPSTAYALGTIVHSPNQVAGTVAVVATAGTSSTSEPTWTSAGNTVTDGSIVYIITYGAYQIATAEEASAGTDDTKVMTPAKVAGVFAPLASPKLTGTASAVNLTVTGKLEGSLTGNADTATKATQDASGNIITDTYATLDALKTTNNNIATLQELGLSVVDGELCITYEE